MPESFLFVFHFLSQKCWLTISKNIFDLGTYDAPNSSCVSNLLKPANLYVYGVCKPFIRRKILFMNSPIVRIIKRSKTITTNVGRSTCGQVGAISARKLVKAVFVGATVAICHHSTARSTTPQGPIKFLPSMFIAIAAGIKH